MIRFRGWGALVAILVLGAAGGGGTGVGIALGGAHSGGNWGTVSGFLLAAVVLWFGGRYINRPREVYSETIKGTVREGDYHRLMFIPVQYLAVVAAGIAVVVAIVLLTR